MANALAAWEQGNLPPAALPAQQAPAPAPEGNLGAAGAPSDWSGYLAANPDVKAAYDGLKSKNKKKYGSPEEYAEYHYRAYGSGEGRAGAPLDDTYTFRTNKANDAGTVQVDPNATYRLVGKKGKSTLAEGQGQQGLDAIYRQATQLSQGKGRKADWTVEVLDPATGKWGAAARDKPGQGTLGKLADIGLPLAGALLMPLTGGASGVLAAGLGAAGGSALSSVAQGRSLKNTLKRAAISGAVGAAGAGIAGAPLGGFGNAAGSTASGAAGGLGGAAAGGGGGAAAPIIGANEMILHGVTQGATGGLGAAVGAGAGGALGSVAGGGGGQPAPSADGEEIVVSADKVMSMSPEELAKFLGPGATAAFAQQVQQSQQADPQKKGLSAKDIANYARLAALGIGVIGGALGGGKGGSTAGTVPKGFGALDNPAFTGSLPTVAPAQTARQMPQQDWSQYGYRPEQSFFSNVPQSYTPPLPGQMDQWSNVGKGYAKGGRTRGLKVRGPGTERSDSIPAYLSDGEYVIDAPTVRAIGSGSREKGFKKLDDLRVHVRKRTPQKALKSLGAR